MFSSLRRRITPSTVIATVALLFAMSGGAYAAGKYLITSTKQIKPSVLASLKGKAGPAGPAGANGAAGPAGPAGSGTPGAEGKQGPKGETGKEGSPGQNGKNGETGFTEKLPPGKTETGTWSLGKVGALPSGQTKVQELVPVSFAIPLAAPLGEGNAHFLIDNEQTKQFEEVYETSGEFFQKPSTVCLGTPEDPKAAPGSLCIYAQQLQGVPEEHEHLTEVASPGDSSGVGPTGAVIRFLGSKEEAYGFGSWAVTAE